MNMDTLCTSCGDVVRSEKSMIGLTMDCPYCGNAFEVSPLKNSQSSKVNNKSSTLISCESCNKSISPEAHACPSCGHPNKKIQKKAKNKEYDNKQRGGCLLLLLGLVVGAFNPTIGGIMVVIGVIIAVINTRVA